MKDTKNDFVTIFDTGFEKLEAKVNYVGGKDSGRHNNSDKTSDADKYNLLELRYNNNLKEQDVGKTETFEVWGEGQSNLENNLFDALDILFGFSSMIIDNGEKYVSYEDFCKDMESNLWDIEAAVSYARTYEYIHKLEKIGLSLYSIYNLYNNHIDGSQSLQELRDSYESSIEEE